MKLFSSSLWLQVDSHIFYSYHPAILHSRITEPSHSICKFFSCQLIMPVMYRMLAIITILSHINGAYHSPQKGGFSTHWLSGLSTGTPSWSLERRLRVFVTIIAGEYGLPWTLIWCWAICCLGIFHLANWTTRDGWPKVRNKSWDVVHLPLSVELQKHAIPWPASIADRLLLLHPL